MQAFLFGGIEIHGSLHLDRVGSFKWLNGLVWDEVWARKGPRGCAFSHLGVHVVEQRGLALGSPILGTGFATEAAQAALEFGFEIVDLSEIVALTVPGNARSRAVMSKLGMTRTASDDFDHPLVPAGHPLKAGPVSLGQGSIVADGDARAVAFRRPPT
jgi:hypothetical protein